MLRMLEGAERRGWATSVAVPDGALAEKAAAVGAARVPIPDLMLPGGPRPLAAAVLAGRYVGAARQLRRACQEVDLVVANGLRVLPVLRLAGLPAPVVWLAQSVVERPKWKMMLTASEPVVDSAVAVSGAVGASISHRRFPVEVVWNGTPWPVPAAPAEPPQPPVVGCASLLVPWKGQDVVLEAVARLGRPDVTVELVGGTFPKDAPYRDSLVRRSNQPDLAGRVRFLGNVDDPVERMRGWTLALVSSVEPEAGPLVLLEAMSIGMPVVATDHGGPPEVLGDAGLLVPPGDPAAMAEAIRTLLDDEALRRRCAEAGRRQVESGLSLDAQMDALLDFVLSRAGVAV